jgi:replication-associated recombination protein RarA
MKLLTITGHEIQRSLLQRLLIKDKLPHALLFSGPAGVGKRQVAYELAMEIFKSKDLNSLLNANPDFREIDCSDRAAVNAENTRELLYSLNLNAFLSGKRVVLLNNAEFLPLQSANILLKTLEEPRKDTHFILISANPYRLPHTLLSRCQIIHFNVLSAGEIDKVIKSNPGFEPCLNIMSEKNITLKELSNYSQGSFENITALVNNFEVWLDMRIQFSKIMTGDISVAAGLSETLSKDKENLRGSLRLLTALVRHEMHEASSNPAFERLATALTALTLADRLIFERNLSASYVLNYILINLAVKDNSFSFTALDESVTMLANC